MEHRPHAVNIPIPLYNVEEIPVQRRTSDTTEIYSKMIKDLVESKNKNMCLNYDTQKKCHSARNTISYIVKKNNYKLSVYERKTILWIIKNLDTEQHR